MTKTGKIDPFSAFLLVLVLACVGVLGYEGLQRLMNSPSPHRAVPAQAQPAPQPKPQPAAEPAQPQQYPSQGGVG